MSARARPLFPVSACVFEGVLVIGLIVSALRTNFPMVVLLAGSGILLPFVAVIDHRAGAIGPGDSRFSPAKIVLAAVACGALGTGALLLGGADTFHAIASGVGGAVLASAISVPLALREKKRRFGPWPQEGPTHPPTACRAALALYSRP